MKIGFISEALPYLPSRGGFRLYGGNLIRLLSQRHTIDLISFLRDDDEEHLSWPEQHCVSICTLPKNKPTPAISQRGLSSSLGKTFLTAGRPRCSAARWFCHRKVGRAACGRAYAAGLIPADLPVAMVLSVHDSWTLRARRNA